MGEDKRSFWIYGFMNFCCIAALAVVILPLLLVARYNVPSADDWSYGRETFGALQSGAGFPTVIRLAFETMAEYYQNWEGRFMNAFFASLQPGIWGERYYGIVAWLMLGGLICGELVLFWILLGGGRRENRMLWLPVAVPTLILQILYTPSVVESFYWYTGAVNYTFVFGLSMILAALFLKLGLGTLRGWRFRLAAAAASLLSVIVGGDNFSTSLSVFLFMAACELLIPVFCGGAFSGRPSYDRELFWRILGRTWYLVLLEGGSLLACVLAPGNASRLAGNFGGGAAGSFAGTVGGALWRSFTNLYSWTNGKVFLMILLILPFVWKAAGNLNHTFRYPGLFTLVTFALYASQIAPTMYVDGTTGGGRMAAILYYSCHVWIVCNVCYWTGWLRRRRERGALFGEKFWQAAAVLVRRFLLLYCAAAGALLAALIYTQDLKSLSSYKAYRDWRQGWAKQYAAEWEERLAVLHDETVTEVEFAPLTVYPETILYTDLQDEEGYTWVNSACAKYYGKTSVRVVRE